MACLCVLFFHVNVAAQDNHIWHLYQKFSSLLGALALAGRSGVILFFLLSGFLLFLPYAKALLFDSPWPSLWQFYLRRTFRIVPAYYVALALMIFLFHPEYLQADYLHKLWLFLTFRMDFPITFESINGPFWTLAVEFQFYILLPLLTWIFGLVVRRGKVGWRVAKLTLCLVGMAAWGVLSLYWSRVWSPQGTLHAFISPSLAEAVNPYIVGGGGKYLETFAFGMLICMLYTYVQHTPQENHWDKALQKLSIPLFLAGMAILSFMAYWNLYYWDQGRTFHFFGRYHTLMLTSWSEWQGLCYAIGFGLCMLALLYGPAWLKRPFEWSPLRWIGLISFSLYMWHDPLIYLFVRVVIIPLHQQVTNLIVLYSLVWVWVLLAIIPFSCASYLLVEKPGVRLGEKLRRKLIKPLPEQRTMPVPAVPVPEHQPAPR